MEYETLITIRLDERTAAFVHALRDEEHINLSAWIRDAIRQKAGLKPDKVIPKKSR